MADADDKPRAALPPPAETVAALIAAGDHVRAAELSVAAGDLPRAIALYDRLWRFADALPLALRLGQSALAVRLALDMGDHRRAVEIADAMPAEPRADLIEAARALAARGRAWDAARTAERAAERALAATLYRRAGAFLDLGRIEEAAGREHEAGLAYEEARARATSGAERAAADLALGRLLGRLGRIEDATRAFQRSMRDPSHRLPAGRALVGTLLALGYPVAAAEAAARLRRIDPSLPASLDDIRALDAADAIAGASPVGLVAAEPRAWARRFKIRRALGAGATSQVYQAEDTLLGHDVALKLLTVTAGAGAAERDAYARFAREAEAAGRLRHPNVVALHDADPAAGLFVWELLRGGALSDRLADKGRLSPAAGRRLALDLLLALAAAHDRGIVHRDVKPANVLFDEADNAKLGDFGAAHLADFGQTQTAGLLGTVAYMAPEQISGGAIGPAADLYALGATLFEALTGRLPFLGPDIVAQHLGETPPTPSAVAPWLSSAHDAVLLRALHKAPGERWESAGEMAAAVAAWPLAPVGEIATDTADTASADAARAHGPGAVGPDTSRARGLAQDADQPMGRSASGTLFKHEDRRLGRSVLLERREVPLVGLALDRLRATAALGGPSVQRILALSEDGRTVTYELVPGARRPIASLSAAHTAALAASRALLAVAMGRGSGADDLPVIVADGGPVLAVVDVLEPTEAASGRGGDEWPDREFTPT